MHKCFVFICYIYTSISLKMEIREPYQTPTVRVVEMQPGAYILQASLDMTWEQGELQH